LNETKESFEWEHLYCQLKDGTDGDDTRQKVLGRLISDIGHASDVFAEFWDTAVIRRKTKEWFEEYRPTKSQLQLVRIITDMSHRSQRVSMGIGETDDEFVQRVGPDKLLVYAETVAKIRAYLSTIDDDTLEDKSSRLGKLRVYPFR